MVRILKNGEIVDDSDPRAQHGSPRQQQNTGRVQHERMQEGGHFSVFDEFNTRLAGYGVPRFNIGSHTVEPIVLIGFIVAGLLFGLPGLLLVAMLFVISKLSTSGGGINSFLGGQGPSGQGDPRSSGSRSTQGSGHRLGRS
ncbi:protein FAM241B-like [Dreissena polymorpha]|uniref:DUF4605 domain-containing protein n=1 Tax=Dreissena polymorpha TaxID=45954 RepID=A0A9D4MB59_DREPO|nr:protein FAM241B-like [Dreissena polymorpha]XP_052267039.1 protein FAM241B-like [Dreissena polymorpha]KAH3873006.1 hypothetical protein DPMN_036230 [Dreissena polymorpha]